LQQPHVGVFQTSIAVPLGIGFCAAAPKAVDPPARIPKTDTRNQSRRVVVIARPL
jgi:hypothetical protein